MKPIKFFNKLINEELLQVMNKVNEFNYEVYRNKDWLLSKLFNQIKNKFI